MVSPYAFTVTVEADGEQTSLITTLLPRSGKLLINPIMMRLALEMMRLEFTNEQEKARNRQHYSARMSTTLRQYEVTSQEEIAKT